MCIHIPLYIHLSQLLFTGAILCIRGTDYPQTPTCHLSTVPPRTVEVSVPPTRPGVRPSQSESDRGIEDTLSDSKIKGHQYKNKDTNRPRKEIKYLL